VNCLFDGKEGQIVLDQIRTIDKTRLVKKLGVIVPETHKEVLATLLEMFSE
jgi:mRNA interferase MazF